LLRTAALVGGTAAVAHHAGVRSQQAQDQEYAQNEAIADVQQQQAAQQTAPAAAAGPSQEGLNKLKELAQLHDQGILTDEEFAAQKAKILGS
jgi:hypothetical protein